MAGHCLWVVGEDTKIAMTAVVSELTALTGTVVSSGAPGIVQLSPVQSYLATLLLGCKARAAQNH